MSGYTSVLLPPFPSAYHHSPPLYTPSSLQAAQQHKPALHSSPPPLPAPHLSHLPHAPQSSPHLRPKSLSSSALPVAPPSLPQSSQSNASVPSSLSSSSPPPLLLPTQSLRALLLPTSPAALSGTATSAAAVCSAYFAGCRTRELPSHRKAVRCVRWSPTGTQLASCALDGSVRIHTLHSLHSNTTHPTPSPPPPQPSSASSLAARPSPSPSSSSSTSSSTSPSSSVEAALELRGHSGSVEAVVWSRAQPWQLASASTDRTVRLWDTNDGRCLEVLQCPGGELISVAWSADGRFIAAGSKANVVALIDVGRQRSQLLCAIHFQTEINEIAFALNSQPPHTNATNTSTSSTSPHTTSPLSPPSPILVLSTGKGAVELLDVLRVKELAALDAAAAPQPPSTAPQRPSPPSVLILAPPPPLCSLDNHSATVYCLDVSADGRLLASGGADAAVCVRESRQLTPLHVLARSDCAVRSVSFSHAALGLLALGAEDGLVEISRLTAEGSSERVWSTQLSAETNCVAFHPFHPLLAYSTDSTAKCVVTLFGVQ